jgi:hypothetical protein
MFARCIMHTETMVYLTLMPSKESRQSMLELGQGIKPDFKINTNLPVLKQVITGQMHANCTIP